MRKREGGIEGGGRGEEEEEEEVGKGIERGGGIER